MRVHDENLHEPKIRKVFSQTYIGDTYTDGSEKGLDRGWTQMDADGLRRPGRRACRGSLTPGACGALRLVEDDTAALRM